VLVLPRLLAGGERFGDTDGCGGEIHHGSEFRTPPIASCRICGELRRRGSGFDAKVD
jgi:hypothetical protein